MLIAVRIAEVACFLGILYFLRDAGITVFDWHFWIIAILACLIQIGAVIAERLA